MPKIYLIGYMGSGKSTTGKELAAKLGYSFIDLDKLIEKDCGQSIPQIFANQGEAEFRKIENNTLKKVIDKDNVVIACGGGTPCYYNNIDLMNNSGITVYLKLSVDTLIARLSVAKEERPLIKNKSSEELKAFISRQLEKREDFYHKAQFTVKGKNLKVGELVDFISQQIKLRP